MNIRIFLAVAFLFAAMPLQAEQILLNGIHKEYYSDGRIKSETNYKNGEPEGLSREYYPNGQLAFVQNVRDGKIDGIVKAYYENGQLKGKTRYVDNVEEGILKEFYENGLVKEEVSYVKGEMINLKKFNEQGKMMVNQDSNFPPSCVVITETPRI